MPIRVRGASEHNLRDVDVAFGDGLTVVTGVFFGAQRLATSDASPPAGDEVKRGP